MDYRIVYSLQIIVYRLVMICALSLSSLICHLSSLNAQSLKASAPEMVNVDEDFRVQYTINTNDASDLDCPSFVGFIVKYGPSTSTQSSVQIVNGSMSQSSSVTYTFILTCDKPGTYTISPASVTYNGRKIRSNSLRIRVVGRGGSSASQSSASPQHQQQSSPAAEAPSAGKDLFMTATASRTSVYEQEAVLITYKVYTLVNLTDLTGKLPTLDGFQIQEIPLPRTKSFGIETYGGRQYNSVIWTQYVVYPQKTGTLKIPAIEYIATEVRANHSVDPLDAIFNGVTQSEYKRKIIAPSLTINVRELLAKPVDFSGGVGHFTVSSSISSNSVKTNDAVTVKLRVRGSGNMKLIQAPELAFPKDFETYDVKVNDDSLSLSRSGLSGTKEFEYLAVPRHKGTYTIPAARLVYFDTNSNSYQTLQTQPYTLHVAQGVGGANTVFGGKQSVEQLGTDIRYIKPGDVSKVSGGIKFSALGLTLMYLLALILGAVAFFVLRKVRLNSANTAYNRGRKANKVALKRLNYASQLLAAGKQNEFYDEVMRALWGYTSDKMNIQQSELNRENISASLAERGVDEELAGKFISCLDECEFARYAPGNPNETMENVYNNAVDVISRMEDRIRKDSSAFRIVLLFMISFLSFTASAQEKQTADEMYSQEQYEEAAVIYKQLLKACPESPALYYNLGNCYYKMDSVAIAVLSYERASLLDPGDSDIRTNLAFARAKTVDKVSPASELFFVTWWKQFANLTNLSLWIIIGFTAFVLLIAVFLAYRWKGRRIIFILLALVFVLANLAALTQYYMQTHRDGAIIMDGAVTVKSSPSESSTDLFVIHEGVKVTILDNSMKDWAEVKLEEGKQGWIQKSTFEVI